MPLIFAALAVVALVGLGSLGRPEILRVATRDFRRRPAQSALVVSGLLVASLVVAASLVAGDAQKEMFLQNVYKSWGPVDLVVGTVSGSALDEETARAIIADPEVARLSDGAAVRIQLPAAVEAKEKGTRESFVNLIGLEPDLDSSLGRFVAKGSTYPDSSEPTVLVTERLANRLGITSGETVVFSTLGLDGRPAAFAIPVGAVVAAEGKAEWNLRPNAFMDLDALQASVGARAGGRGQVTQIVASARGTDFDRAAALELEEAILAAAKRVAPARDISAIRVAASKVQGVAFAEQQSEFLRTVLTALGAIVALTSVALIVNLFVMLGEERRHELGTMRALGLKRGGLILLGMTEGVLYAGTAAVVGAGIGGLFGRYLAEAMMEVFASFASQDQAEFSAVPFELNLRTLMTAAAAGFLISVVSVLVVSFRTSRLSIVAAIRGLPETRTRRRRIPILQGVAMAAGAFLAALGSGSGEPMPVFIGGVLLAVGGGSIFGRYAPTRVASTVAALTMMIWGLYGYIFLPEFDEDFQIGFVVVTTAAIVVVIAAVVLVSANLTVFERVGALFGPRLRAVVRVATGYPVGYRLRTGLSMAMFGLVLYMVAAFAVWGGLAGGDYESQSGGFDVVARSTVPVEDVRLENASNIVPMYRTRYDLGYRAGSSQELRFPVQLFGVDKSMASGSLKFSATLPGADEERTWETLASSTDAALLDTGSTPGGVEPGDSLELRTDQGVRRFRVIGILDQFWMTGIFVSKQAFSEMYPVRSGNMGWLVSARPGTTTMRLAQELERSHASAGMDAQTVKEIFDEASAGQRTFVGLFQVLLKLGLLIGVSGLAIGSVRTVLERRQAVGVLRALGFKRHMVGTSLLLESLLVATLGCAIGVAIGLPGTFFLVREQLPNIGFNVDWAQVLSTLAIVYAAVLTFTAIPAWRAARLHPADAVRYVE